MKEEDSKVTKRLNAMVGELDITSQVEASRVLTNLLKVQRAQKRIARRADAAVEELAKIDIVTAEHMKENECQCSFCKKWQGEVELMIAGPAGAFICCECVDRCVDAVKDFRDNS